MKKIIYLNVILFIIAFIKTERVSADDVFCTLTSPDTTRHQDIYPFYTGFTDEIRLRTLDYDMPGESITRPVFTQIDVSFYGYSSAPDTIHAYATLRSGGRPGSVVISDPSSSVDSEIPAYVTPPTVGSNSEMSFGYFATFFSNTPGAAEITLTQRSAPNIQASNAPPDILKPITENAGMLRFINANPLINISIGEESHYVRLPDVSYADYHCNVRRVINIDVTPNRVDFGTLTKGDTITKMITYSVNSSAGYYVTFSSDKGAQKRPSVNGRLVTLTDNNGQQLDLNTQYYYGTHAPQLIKLTLQDNGGVAGPGETRLTITVESI